MSGADEDTDFTRLPLNERLEHKLWKARLHGYQELNETFKNDPEGRGAEYWQTPELFGKYLVDSNVVAQEQAVLSLESLINNIRLPPKSSLRSILEIWIPALAEKGLSSSRPTTKNKATECILLLCSYDNSISQCVELVLPFCEKKLPKLVATSAHCLKELLACFGLTNVQTETLLPQLLEPLGKLASHADRNVRSETMGLIVEIYKCTGKNKPLLQELLLDQLKPIQQRDLDKLFKKADSEDSNKSTRLFIWQKEQLERAQQQQHPATDHDGDTMMEIIGFEKDAKLQSAKQPLKPVDPLDLLPEQTILDKLPDDFYNRVSSSKWKERVESLQELWDNVLSKLKKLKTKQQDYTELLSTLGHIIQKDANVQAVSLAAHSVQQICSKLKPPAFNKHYVSCVFIPLLERTKEKKSTVVEVVRGALQAVCRQQYPLAPSGHNEDMLQDILQFMKHKTPQIRAECTELFTFVLKQICHYEPSSVKLLQKYLQDEIGPAVMKIVNDTQPAIRNCGFECFATLIRIVGQKDMNLYWEKLDNLKRQKIEEHLSNQPPASFDRHSRPSSSSFSSAPSRADPSASSYAAASDSLQLGTSTIPSKRGPPSPLKKTGKVNSPSAPKSRVLLTSRTLGGGGGGNSASTAHTGASTAMHASIHANAQKNLQANTEAKIQADAHAHVAGELERLQKDKSEWINERHELLAQMSKLSSSQTQLINENEALREQLKVLQTEMHERGLQLRSKDLQLGRLQDRIAQMELDFRDPSITKRHISSSEASAISTNLGVRSISSSSFDPAGVKSKHLRTPSESSDDLPRRVDSLQLTSGNNQPISSGAGVGGVNATTTASSSASSDAINEESWKRAAEVTSQLKARIERMRAKTRGIK